MEAYKSKVPSSFDNIAIGRIKVNLEALQKVANPDLGGKLLDYTIAYVLNGQREALLRVFLPP